MGKRLQMGKKHADERHELGYTLTTMGSNYTHEEFIGTAFPAR